MADIPLVSQTVAFADAKGHTPSNPPQCLAFLLPGGTGGAIHDARKLNDINDLSKGWLTSGTTAGRIAASRHMEGANYAFADGHVKWLKSIVAETSEVNNADRFNSPPKAGLDYDGDGIVGTNGITPAGGTNPPATTAVGWD